MAAEYNGLNLPATRRTHVEPRSTTKALRRQADGTDEALRPESLGRLGAWALGRILVPLPILNRDEWSSQSCALTEILASSSCTILMAHSSSEDVE